MAELNENEPHFQELTNDVSKEKIQKTALQELQRGNYDFALKAIQKGGVDFSELIENLKIYQAELEIQNEELRDANLKKDSAFQRFSQLFDYLPLPVFVIDSYGIIHNANFSAEKRFNMSLQALCSHYFPRLVSKSHHRLFRNLINQATETGLPVSDEISLHPNQQPEFTADLNVVSLANQPSELQFIVIIIDQTQRIQQTAMIELQRRRFSAYFETAPVGIATVNPDKQWQDVNQTLCQLLGYTRTELLAKKFARFNTYTG
ncbi:PAS domain-containing protein [Methylocucumis oryzae]|uniref:PAS domain-containing protein n=1 Tax=Methylocucumis oryzae TaxID=1632867 RepID=A0A0F3IN27_9GAMM|nr:PAS domain-containing protein [Methylocucumis oryzae]KJV08116.1 hypothetical protein VZ94_00205 [Methylocucumis oryzae]